MNPHDTSEDKYKSYKNDKPESSNARSQNSEENRSGTLEKIFTILSLALIATMIAFLVKESAAPQTPPRFTLKSSDPLKLGEFTAIDLYVKNSGDEAAKAVNLKGEITGDDGKPIEAEATMDWLPGRSTRKVTMMFPKDMPTTTPEFEVVGYEEP